MVTECHRKPQEKELTADHLSFRCWERTVAGILGILVRQAGDLRLEGPWGLRNTEAAFLGIHFSRT